MRIEMKKMSLVSVALAAAVSAVLVVGCSTAPRDEGSTRELAINSQAAIDSFKAKDPSLASLMDKAVGWAVFPDIGKGGWIVGGSYGKGEVFEGGKKIGHADISEVSAGFQWGAQNFSEILLFMNQQELDKFKDGDWSLGGNVSAVALTEGAADKTDPSKGVIAVVDTKGGLMAEAAVGGQRIRFAPL